jgi:DNA repair photolyase
MIPHGRGATINPAGRFEKIEVAIDAEFEDPNPRTVYLRDASQSAISMNDSPDIGFRASVNPYRGCEHGCSYCYARPYHEYLGFSAGVDFETRIMVKPDAPQLLRKELASPKWQPQPIAMSGVTDCYQPVERKLKITRGCLHVLAEFRNPVGLVTKNHLVTRDIDLLSELAAVQAASVHISITTLDAGLARKLEPRAASPAHRLEAVRQLTAAGIPVGVLVAPVIPGLNDHEIPAILEAARGAGALRAGYTMLRLPHGVKDVFSAWLDENLPGSKEKILGRIREVRGGKLNDSTFGTRMRGEGVFAEQVRQLFAVSLQRQGFADRMPALSTAAFRNRGDGQLNLF